MEMKFKGGFAETADTDSQIQTTLKKAGATRKKKPEHRLSNEIKMATDLVTTQQICVGETKNLHAEQQTTEVLRRNEADVKGKIVEHAFWMQKEGYAEATITRRIRFLKTLSNKGANLQDPESVKETLAKQQLGQQKPKKSQSKPTRSS